MRKTSYLIIDQSFNKTLPYGVGLQHGLPLKP